MASKMLTMVLLLLTESISSSEIYPGFAPYNRFFRARKPHLIGPFRVWKPCNQQRTRNGFEWLELVLYGISELMKLSTNENAGL